MDITQANEYSRFKLAQLWHILNGTHPETRKTYLHNRVVNEILKDEFNVNCKITVNFEPFRGMLRCKKHVKDCTALHFLCYPISDIDTFTKLIERGADFTVKNANGQTVLHRMITECTSVSPQKATLFINSVLSAHVKFQNSTNPRDNNGFSHLHAACMANHVEAVQLLLDNGASINEAVNYDALKCTGNALGRLFAGYTALHFAMQYFSFDVAQILVNRGADVNAKTTNGASPMDILIERKIIDISSKETSLQRDGMINLLLEKNAISMLGFSNLQIACTLKELTMAERLLDEGADIEYAVPEKSRSFSGNTSLHFAVNNSLKAVELLLKRGAKLNVANAQELTPLDSFISNYSLQDLCKILLYVPNWKGIHLSDGQTVLLDLIAAMSDLSQFKLFLENEIKDLKVAVPIDSELWPGCTILHLAVIFSKKLEYNSELREQGYDKVVVEECMKRGLSLDVQDVRGRSPIHEAFRRGKNSIVKLFLQRLDESTELVNLMDEDNLSYLHIACAINDESVAGKLLHSCDPNSAFKGKHIQSILVTPGSTALHAVAANGSSTIANMLLQQGADLHAKDTDGFTPIHWLLNFGAFEEHQGSGNTLFTALLADPQDRVVEGYSYLHVACHVGHIEAAEKLLDLGSDVNAVIEVDESSASETVAYFKSLYSNVTPLQMAAKILDANEAILNLLLRRGADVFVKQKSPECKCVMPGLSSQCPLKNKLVLRCLLQALWDQQEMQKDVAEKLGLTKLHIACYLKNKEAIGSALSKGTDVNVQVPANSAVFAGCTGLHLLLTIADEEDFMDFLDQQLTIGGMVKILVNRGADVTIANVENDTPIHVLSKHENAFRDGARCRSLLLNAQQDFSVNPSNADGITHFHLACYWLQNGIVSKFLQNGSVNVDQSIEYFAKRFAGCTPLHLVLSNPIARPNTNNNNNGGKKFLQLIDLLLRHGADVAAQDVAGDTPLHKPAALSSPKMNVMDQLVSHGADVNSRNIRSQTPIEKLMDINGINVNVNQSDCLKILKKYNYKINSWNYLTGEGYIAKLFLSARGNLRNNSEFKEFLQTSDAKTIDNSGRTAIHNAVAASENQLLPGNIQNYIYAVQSLVDMGIDVNHQDKSGQTALHYATRLENTIAVEALLACGVDVNIIDNIKKSAFSYATENSKHKNILHYFMKPNVTIVLRLHIKKLQHLRIEVSPLNQDLVKRLQQVFEQSSYIRLTRVNTRFGDPKNLSQEFFNQVEATKTMNIGTNSLTLFDFLSEAGELTLYPLLLGSERKLVDSFFEMIDYKQLGELADIVKLQYKKMSARLALIDPALRSLRTLLGFSIPGLSEQISRYLSYSDLKNLIKSTAL